MLPIRHSCHSRLFDSQFPCMPIDGNSADISLLCTRCSRKQHQSVVARYSLKLPRYLPSGTPKPVHCGNASCYARIADLGLPYTLAKEGEHRHISLKCGRCGELTYVQLSGLAEVH